MPPVAAPLHPQPGRPPLPPVRRMGPARMFLIVPLLGGLTIAAAMPCVGAFVAVHRLVPGRVGWDTLTGQSPTLPALMFLAAGAASVLWAWFVYALGRETVARLLRRPARRRRWRLPVPMHQVAAGMAGTAVLAAASVSRPDSVAILAATQPAPTAGPAPAAAVTAHLAAVRDTDPRPAHRAAQPFGIAGTGAATNNPVSGSTPARVRLVSAVAPVLPAGPGVLTVGGCHHPYTVVEGDTLWHIARTCLGDGNRWPEIWELNKGRFWPTVSGHIRFHDPDLIYPQWTLTLPAEAQPPAQTPATTPAPSPATPSSLTPTPPPALTPTMPSTPEARSDGVADGPTAPVPAPTPAANPVLPSPTSTSHPTPTPPPHGVGHGDETGVRLPTGSWIPWGLAGALVSAMAVVWLQRRTRYRPHTLDDADGDGPTLARPAPLVLRQIQGAWRTRARAHNPATVPPPSPTAQPAPVPPPPTVHVPDVPHLDLPAPGGVGLHGPGALAAARGALVAGLAAGAPTDPDARTEVVIPADTLVTLLGADAATLGSWARLRVTPDLDTALALLEERLLFAARVLDDSHADDITALRHATVAEQPVPPMLLIAATPPAGLQARTRTILGLGAAVQVSAVLLGEWAHGTTVRVDADGTCHPTGPADTGIPDRMAILEPADAYDLLVTLRKAHTGLPGPAAHPDRAGPATAVDGRSNHGSDQPMAIGGDEKWAAVAPETAHNNMTSDHGHGPEDGVDPDGGPASEDAPGKAVIRVLGRPDIPDRPRTETMRSYATEVMVYLAVHADGASPEQILDDLWPEERPRTTAIRLHTGVSNLRKLLAESVHSTTAGLVLRQHGRYRLNPDQVDVDLWRLRAGHTAARGHSATDPDARIIALRQACDAYTAALADGADYPWVESHREGARGMAIDVHTALAAALADTDPAEAARLLDTAARHDPTNEHVHRQAMHAHYRLGDPEAIRSLLRQLTLALAELDLQPSVQTADLADRLRHDLEQRQVHVA
jgi:DNA-binding SARP family transcriptional activator